MKTSVEYPVLSAIIKSPKCIDEITGIITSDDFENIKNRQIFNTVCSLVTDGKPVDVFTISESIPDIDLEYVVEIAKCYGSPTNVKAYAQKLAEIALIRRLARAGEEIQRIAGDGSMDAQSRLYSSLMALNSVSKKTGDSISFSKSMIMKWSDSMEARMSRNSTIQGLSTGFDKLDNVTSGFSQGNLIIIAGRPSMGKSAFALSIADEMLKNGKSVYFESIEMPEQSLIDRLISRRSGVNLADIKSATMSPDEWNKSTAAAASLSVNKLAVSESFNVTVFEIMSRCRRVQQVHGLDCVMIDYLQLISGGGGENETIRIGNITRELKGMSKALNVPVVVLSQLNRGLEQRADKKPLMADLRQSGSIEQDADLIIFMHRPYVYDKAEDQSLGFAVVAKNRDGETGDIPITWESKNAAYFSFSGEYSPQQPIAKKYESYKSKYE